MKKVEDLLAANSFIFEKIFPFLQVCKSTYEKERMKKKVQDLWKSLVFFSKAPLFVNNSRCC